MTQQIISTANSDYSFTYYKSNINIFTPDGVEVINWDNVCPDKGDQFDNADGYIRDWVSYRDDEIPSQVYIEALSYFKYQINDVLEKNIE